MKSKILLLFILPFFSFTAHKYYLSLTEIEYNKENKSLQIIINVFMDDIESALNKDYNINLQLTSSSELKNSDSYFIKYLKEKLKFSINNDSLDFNYIGKEYEGDLVFFYLEIENITTPSPLSISNTILVEHFPEQQNVVKMKIDKERKSKILNKKNDKALLKF